MRARAPAKASPAGGGGNGAPARAALLHAASWSSSAASSSLVTRVTVAFSSGADSRAHQHRGLKVPSRKPTHRSLFVPDLICIALA